MTEPFRSRLGRERHLVRHEVLQPDLEHPAQGQQRREAWVERRARARLALLELLIGVRRDPGQVRGPLLAQPPAFSRLLEPHPDLPAELLPGGRLTTTLTTSLHRHAPILLIHSSRMVIPMWQFADDPALLWTTGPDPSTTVGQPV